MNKNGWGLRVELVFILIFLIALVISTVLLNQIGLFDDMKYDTGNSNYSDVENDLVDAAKSYINQNYESDMLESVTLVTYSTLKNQNYIEKLKDYTGKECTGYVEVIKDEGMILFYPYVKCARYISSKYDSSKDW